MQLIDDKHNCYWVKEKIMTKEEKRLSKQRRESYNINNTEIPQKNKYTNIEKKHWKFAQYTRLTDAELNDVMECSIVLNTQTRE